MVTPSMLLMDRNAWGPPESHSFCFEDQAGACFSKTAVGSHGHTFPLSSLSVGEMIDFGWKLLRT